MKTNTLIFLAYASLFNLGLIGKSIAGLDLDRIGIGGAATGLVAFLCVFYGYNDERN